MAVSYYLDRKGHLLSLPQTTCLFGALLLRKRSESGLQNGINRHRLVAVDVKGILCRKK